MNIVNENINETDTATQCVDDPSDLPDMQLTELQDDIESRDALSPTELQLVKKLNI